jgi:ABC-type transport system substrate-binding protein
VSPIAAPLLRICSFPTGARVITLKYQPQIDNSRSIAEPGVFADGNTTVTIKLKNDQWSDGQPVTLPDVEFCSTRRAPSLAGVTL